MLEVTNTAHLATFRAAVHYDVDISHIRIPAAARVLDLGCGMTGSYITHKLYERDPTLQLFFVDAFAENLKSLKLPGERRQGVSTALPFSTDSFDLVITAEMTPDNSFFQRNDSQTAINIRDTKREIDRVLGPTGQYVAYHEVNQIAPLEYRVVFEDLNDKTLKNGKCARGLTFGVYAKDFPDKGSLSHFGRMVCTSYDHDERPHIATYLVQQLSGIFPQTEALYSAIDCRALAEMMQVQYGKTPDWRGEFEALTVRERLKICMMSAVYSGTGINQLPSYWQALYHAHFALDGSASSALKALAEIDSSDWLYQPLLKVLNENPIAPHLANESLSSASGDVRHPLIRAIVGSESSSDLFSALFNRHIPKDYHSELVANLLSHAEPYYMQQLLCSKFPLTQMQEAVAFEALLANPSGYGVAQVLKSRAVTEPYLGKMLGALRGSPNLCVELYKANCLPPASAFRLIEVVIAAGAAYYAADLLRSRRFDADTELRLVSVVVSDASSYLAKDLQKARGLSRESRELLKRRVLQDEQTSGR